MLAGRSVRVASGGVVNTRADGNANGGELRVTAADDLRVRDAEVTSRAGGTGGNIVLAPVGR